MGGGASKKANRSSSLQSDQMSNYSGSQPPSNRSSANNTLKKQPGFIQTQPHPTGMNYSNLQNQPMAGGQMQDNDLARNGAGNVQVENTMYRLPDIHEEHDEEQEDDPAELELQRQRRSTRRNYRMSLGLDLLSENNPEGNKEQHFVDQNAHKLQLDNMSTITEKQNLYSVQPEIEESVQNKPQERLVNQQYQEQALPVVQQTESQLNQPIQVQSPAQNQQYQQQPTIEQSNLIQPPQQQFPVQQNMVISDPNIAKNELNPFPTQQQESQIKKPEENTNINSSERPSELPQKLDAPHLATHQQYDLQNLQHQSPQKVNTTQQLGNSQNPTLSESHLPTQSTNSVVQNLNSPIQQPNQNLQPSLQNQQHAILSNSDSINSSGIQSQQQIQPNQPYIVHTSGQQLQSSSQLLPPQYQILPQQYQVLPQQYQVLPQQLLQQSQVLPQQLPQQSQVFPQSQPSQPQSLTNSQLMPQLDQSLIKSNQNSNPLAQSQLLHINSQIQQQNAGNTILSQSLNPKLLPNQQDVTQPLSPQKQQTQETSQSPQYLKTELPPNQSLAMSQSNDLKQPTTQLQSEANKQEPNSTQSKPDQPSEHVSPNIIQSQEPSNPVVKKNESANPTPQQINMHAQEQNHPMHTQNIKSTSDPQTHSNTQSLSISQPNVPSHYTQGPNSQDFTKSIDVNPTQSQNLQNQPPLTTEEQPPRQNLGLSSPSGNKTQTVNPSAIGSSQQILQQNPQNQTHDQYTLANSQSQKTDPLHPQEDRSKIPTQLPGQSNPVLQQQQQQASPQNHQSYDSNLIFHNSHFLPSTKREEKYGNNPTLNPMIKDQYNTLPPDNSKLNIQSPQSTLIKPNSKVGAGNLNSPTIVSILSTQQSPSISDPMKQTPTYMRPVPPSSNRNEYMGLRPRFQNSSANLSNPNDAHNKTISFSESQNGLGRDPHPRSQTPNQKIMDYYSSQQNNQSKNTSAQSDTKFYNPRHFTPPQQQQQGLPPLIIDFSDPYFEKKNGSVWDSSTPLVNHPLLQKTQPRAASTGRRSSNASSNTMRRDSTPRQRPQQLQLHPQPPNFKPNNSGPNSFNESSPQFKRKAYPGDSIAGIFQNAPYDSQELLSTHSGSVWVPSPKSENRHTPSRLARNFDHEYYNTLARGEYDRQGNIPFKRPEQEKVGRGGAFPANEPRGRHIRQPSFPISKVNQSFTEQSVRTVSENDRLQPLNLTASERADFIDDVSYSLQGTSAKRTRMILDENATYNEFSGRLDTTNERVNIEYVSPWKKQVDGTALPAIRGKPNYPTQPPQIFKKIDSYNPLIKTDPPNRTSRSNPVSNSLLSFQPKEPPALLPKPKFQRNELPEYVLKVESNHPSDKSPTDTANFEFNFCMTVLTSDNSLEQLKNGQPVEFILNKANIPNDRAKAKVLKKIFELNLERGHYLRQPIHVKELVDQFLTAAKSSCGEPFSYLEDLASENSTSLRPEFQDLLETNIEFFHYMGFYLQHEKLFNYYDRWWNFPRDDEYIANLNERVASNVAILRRQINDLVWRKKDIEESEMHHWSYTRVWGGREMRALETSRRYLKYLFTESIRKKNKEFVESMLGQSYL